ncbi:MAG: alpha-amylase family glycosyl hydrolase [Solirubrobacteraceae bacterium]
MTSQPWWRRGVVYQVYPRSFADGDGDGVGDLRGLRDRLEHLVWLGVDAVWLSPIYPSPMVDFGYDITDHTAVDPLFGTLADFDALVAEAHRLGVRVLLDLIPNHTSSRHPWFVEARASRASGKRDWYLWRDPALDGGPPNNWRSVFGGPAWTLDEPTGQFYYHAYLPEQPDLNWREPRVREAMLDVLRFWLDRGVDGFRVDALRHLLKDPEWRDNPPNPAFRPGMPPYDALLPVRSADGEDVLEPIAAIRRVLLEHGDPVEERPLIGELYVPIERLVRYYGRDGRGVQLPSNMHLIATPWESEAIAALVERYEAALPAHGWPNWVLGNHDRSRIASRVGPAQARVAAMLLLTLRGTPTLYYGDELGMRDVPIPAEHVQDPYERNLPGIGVGRDPERTPMPWDAAPNAGFCPPGACPWLPIGEDNAQRDVAAQRRDPRSMLALHRRLLAMRRRSEALAGGGYRTVAAGAGVLVYLREGPGEQVLVALNLTSAPGTARLSGRVRLSTRLDREGERVVGELRLRADEGVVLEAGAAR